MFSLVEQKKIVEKKEQMFPLCEKMGGDRINTFESCKCSCRKNSNCEK